MDHVDWLDEAAACRLASRLADQVGQMSTGHCLPEQFALLHKFLASPCRFDRVP